MMTGYKRFICFQKMGMRGFMVYSVLLVYCYNIPRIVSVDLRKLVPLVQFSKKKYEAVPHMFLYK